MQDTYLYENLNRKNELGDITSTNDNIKIKLKEMKRGEPNWIEQRIRWTCVFLYYGNQYSEYTKTKFFYKYFSDWLNQYKLLLLTLI
jgi:hypothetical protein